MMWQAYECVSKTSIGQMREGCAQDDSQNPFWDDNPQMRYQLKTSHDDACRWLEQHQIQH